MLRLSPRASPASGRLARWTSSSTAAWPSTPTACGKYINLDPETRFVSRSLLRDSYLQSQVPGWLRSSDGKIGCTESALEFERLDVNSDGVIDNSEWLSWGQSHRKDVPDLDCKVSDLEFGQQDVNDDGVIDKAEWTVMVQQLRTLAEGAPPYVLLDESEGIELGLVDTARHIEVATAVSSVLTRSIEGAIDVYLPEDIVRSAQYNYVSPHAVTNNWGRSGMRFVLSRRVSEDTNEVMGTALISHSKDLLFFFTSKYNSVKHSEMARCIDFDMQVDIQGHKWFDKFSMPDLAVYKPPNCHQLANFAIDSTLRGKSLGKFLITSILRNYALNYRNCVVTHSQPLFAGHGLFQIADPSWLSFMLKIGFQHRRGAETFFMDHDWAPLPLVKAHGKLVGNVEFNSTFGMPQIYQDLEQQSPLQSNSFSRLLETGEPTDVPVHLTDRIPHVVALAKSPKAKLQYFQLVLPLNNFQE